MREIIEGVKMPEIGQPEIPENNKKGFLERLNKAKKKGAIGLSVLALSFPVVGCGKENSGDRQEHFDKMIILSNNNVNLSEVDRDNIKRIDTAINESGYSEDDLYHLYGMVQAYHLYNEKDTDFDSKKSDVINTIQSGQTDEGSEGYQEIIAPIIDKYERSENDELDYNFSQEERDLRLKTVSNVLNSEIPTEVQAELLVMIGDTEYFSFNRAENPEKFEELGG